MTVEHKPVGENRYRESFGRYLEDFHVGDVYEHRPGRTISETDNTWFTLLTMNTHPLHFDAEYAAKSEFGRPLVNSCLTLSMVAGMSVSDLSQKAIGVQELRTLLPGSQARPRRGRRGGLLMTRRSPPRFQEPGDTACGKCRSSAAAACALRASGTNPINRQR